MQSATNKKVINGWAMYDWANSAYNLVITSTIFPVYYDAVTSTKNIKGEIITDTVSFLGIQFHNAALYNYALAFAYLVIVFLSPILSSIADSRGNKKAFMQFFCYLGSLACCSMFWFDKNHLGLGIWACIIAAIGYCGSLVFYNAYLPEIAPTKMQDAVSAKGFSYGYIGSVLLQIICFVFVMAKPFGMTDGFAAQLSFLLVGIWWLSFAQITFKVLPKSLVSNHQHNKNFLLAGFVELKKVWHQVQQLKELKKFLAAFLLYSMGVQTVMLAATLFGSQVLNLPTSKLIICILIIQLVAIAGAYLMSNLSTKIGNIKVLMIAVSIWILVCVAAYFTTNEFQFYTIAAIVGLVMGGIQSLSRSTYAKLMPQTTDTASFFSFYDVTEKIAIVIGMFSFGSIHQITGDMRHAIVSLIVFFFIGFILLSQMKKRIS